MISITYHSKRAGRDITRESDGDDWEMEYGQTEGDEEVRTLHIVRENGKEVLADLDRENVQTRKDAFDAWTYVGRLVDVGGTMRVYCDTCGEIEGDVSLAPSDDILHVTCPDCNGIYEGWAQ